MSEVTYYRWSATVPLLVPLVAQFVYRDNPAIGLFDRVAIPLYLSGIAWPAYIPFAPPCSGAAGQPAARYRRVVLDHAGLFLPPFLAYLLPPRPVVDRKHGAVGRSAHLLFYCCAPVRVGYCVADPCGAARAAWRGGLLLLERNGSAGACDG